MSWDFAMETDFRCSVIMTPCTTKLPLVHNVLITCTTTGVEAANASFGCESSPGLGCALGKDEVFS